MTMKNNTLPLFIILLFTILISTSFGQEGGPVTIDVNSFNKIKYFSAIEYSKNAGLKHSFVEKKDKLIIQYRSKKIILSPNNSFLLIDDKAYNLSIPTIYDGSDFWVPLEPFLRISNVQKLPVIRLDSSEKKLLVDYVKSNIKACEVVNKENGLVIKIETDKFFDKNVISTSITRGGWLNVNVKGGILDSIGVLENSRTNSSVIQIKPIQNEKSAQISFLLKEDFEDYGVSSNKNTIKISLRSDIAYNAEKIKNMKKRWNLDVIVIDPGHGGKDPGCLVPGKELYEKTVTLDVAKKLGKLIEKELGIKVIYTRTEDEFIPLWKRTKIANESGGKLFLSLHVNAAPNARSARGFETYFIRPGKFDDATEVAKRENQVIELEQNTKKYPALSRENLIIATMAQSSFTKQSEFFAGEVQRELHKMFPSTKNRGVKQAGFHVLVGASMPNVLIELGFITNSKDYNMLIKSKNRQKMAKAIFESIVTYKNKYENEL
tara:strand:- start:1354 stop:2826 length:1473 start_codon:yes stop_codon:yes gene_type:complete